MFGVPFGMESIDGEQKNLKTSVYRWPSGICAVHVYLASKAGAKSSAAIMPSKVKVAVKVITIAAMRVFPLLSDVCAFAQTLKHSVEK